MRLYEKAGLRILIQLVERQGIKNTRTKAWTVYDTTFEKVQEVIQKALGKRERTP